MTGNKTIMLLETKISFTRGELGNIILINSSLLPSPFSPSLSKYGRKEKRVSK